ncbi:MAG TPA: hypothetical protein VHB21_19950, partial [Minicystis sp.]|nr:hypothetical protein [Minicystis sp.]
AVALAFIAMVPIFWVGGRATHLRCDRSTARCVFELRHAKDFPVAALKGVKVTRYGGDAHGGSAPRRAVELTVDGQGERPLALCDEPDDARGEASVRAAASAVRAFLEDPKAPPVVDVGCEVERFSLYDKFVYTITGLIVGAIALLVAAVPRRVEATFDTAARRLRYVVRRIALARGARDVPFDDVDHVELVTSRGGRTRSLSLVMKNGERWALANAATGTPEDATLDAAKIRVEEVLAPNER